MIPMEQCWVCFNIVNAPGSYEDLEHPGVHTVCPPGVQCDHDDFPPLILGSNQFPYLDLIFEEVEYKHTQLFVSEYDSECMKNPQIVRSFVVRSICIRTNLFWICHDF